ncbi:dynamin family protein [Allochromatium humboldtianum]|uniref:Dynamin family protein n=1 Tax=Allochromatium humboldtianum TaxID=504901 RepID=A0A850RKK6_9GAMM|nr:dynamin family protein [Allochromatium humboldtianum]NVZ11410.1 dynamin family protein [Allochromatium humboldtianum]
MTTTDKTQITPCVRKAFLVALGQLRDDFNNVKVDIEQREATLRRAIDDLTRSTLSTSDTSVTLGLTVNNPLAIAVKNANKKIEASLKVWQEKIERYECNTEFRKNFGDSLLVYVYGKVKAGKSSIGNYVAYGHGDPDDAIIEAGLPSPEFFFEKAAKKNEQLETEATLKERRKFAVDACEATASIQGFKLSGLTWIDSPGLHSKTEVNGKLAQEYVDAADLILYPMSSSAPGRASDLEEIANLLQNGKRVEVVITRCDVTEEDENDNGEIFEQLVMKSKKDRDAQSKHVYDEIIKIKPKTYAKDNGELEVLTVSVRYAEMHSNDPVELENSGMTALFHKLTALTQSDGVRLKQETPINNLRVFVDHIRAGDLSVQALRDDLKPLADSIKQQRQELQQKQSVVVGRVLSELNPLIDDAVRKEKTRRDMKALERTCTEHLQRVVEKHTNKALNEIFEETQNAVNTAVRFQEFKDLPAFRDITKDIEISSKAKGGGWGGLLGGVAGAGIGFLVAGPAGAIAGASIGSGVGGVAGASLAGSRTERISLGDNMHDVLVETTKIFNEAAEKIVATAFEGMDQNFLMPIEQRAKDVNLALDRFIVILNQEVYPK